MVHSLVQGHPGLTLQSDSAPWKLQTALAARPRGEAWGTRTCRVTGGTSRVSAVAAASRPRIISSQGPSCMQWSVLAASVSQRESGERVSPTAGTASIVCFFSLAAKSSHDYRLLALTQPVEAGGLWGCSPPTMPATWGRSGAGDPARLCLGGCKLG